MFSHTILILNIFHEINPNHLIQLIYPIQIQRIWTAQLFRCFAVTQLPLALLLGLTSWTNAMFSNFQGGFSNPWTFHNIAGLRLYDAAGIYKEPWSWLWQRKCGPQHAEVPGHCQWIECWTIMLCPACFSRTTNCSPLFCTLICSRVLQWECVSPMGVVALGRPFMCHQGARQQNDELAMMTMMVVSTWPAAGSDGELRTGRRRVTTCLKSQVLLQKQSTKNKKNKFRQEKQTKNIETQILTTIDEWPPLALACRLRGFWCILHSRTGTEGGKYSGV